jgi:hypothetical protein
MTYTRNATCKDCAYLSGATEGKRKLHACDNIKSHRYRQAVALKTKVCDEWKLVREEDEK